MDVFSLNEQLDTFRSLLNDGRGSIVGPITGLLKIIVAIEIAFAGIYLAIGGNANLIELCKKILKVGALFWLISFYPKIVGYMYDGFLWVGVKVGSGAGGGGVSVATLQNPDAILNLGTNFLNRLLQYASTSGATNGWGIPTLTTLVIFICALPSFVALGLMAINVFITYLEFTMIGSVAFALVPFALFKPFSWLFDRAQGAVISLGIKAMVLALVVAMTDTILNTHDLAKLLTQPIVPGPINEQQVMAAVTFSNCAQFFILCLTLLILSFHAPSLAVTLLGGGPQLTAGSIASAMRGTMHNLESGRGLAQKSLGMASTAATAPAMGALGSAAKFGGGARGAIQALKEGRGNQKGGGNEAGSSGVRGIGQLAQTGMAAMYGGIAATAGDAVSKGYQATGGKFEKALSSQGTKGETLGRSSVLNASNLFGAKKQTENKKDEKKEPESSKKEEKDKKEGNSAA